MRRRLLLWTTIFLVMCLAVLLATFFYSRSWGRGLILRPVSELMAANSQVALTFDDGPSASRTMPLLALLRRYKVRATFFMLGKNIEKYPQAAKAVHLDGHVIGNYSYSHQRMIFRSPAFMKNEIDATDRLIEALGQSRVSLFRPPYSAKYLLLPIMLRVRSKILVTGSYYPPSQYKRPYDAEKVAREVIVNVRPGSIIYLHDGNEDDPEAFVESVRIVIEELSARHYQFVAIDSQSLEGTI